MSLMTRRRPRKCPTAADRLTATLMTRHRHHAATIGSPQANNTQSGCATNYGCLTYGCPTQSHCGSVHAVTCHNCR
jgi:hypothetical protein